MKLGFLLSASAFALLATEALAQMVPAPGQPLPRTDPNGVYCREFTQSVMIGGVRHEAYGTSCQQPDGSWRVVSNNLPPPQPEQPVQYLSPPQYVSAPQYVVAPPAYYAPAPVYYAQPYPYYAGPSVAIGVGFGGGYHGGYYRR